MGRRAVDITIHWALKPDNTSHSVDEHEEKVGRQAPSPKHVSSEEEYVGRLLVVNNEVKLDVPPI
jgi:hypothetical protein